MAEQFEEFALSPEESAQLQGEGPAATEAAAAEPAPQEAAPAEETGEPAAAAPAEPTPPAQQQPVKTVPLAALHEARAEIKEMRQKLALVDQLKNEIINMRQAQAAPPETIPDFNDDPFGATQAGFRHVGKGFEQIQAELAKRDEMIQGMAQQLQHNRVMMTVQQAEQSFKSQTPDYEQAVAHVANVKIREMEAMGITDPETMNATLQQQVWQPIIQAMRTGQNPAKVMYDLAVLYGYQKPGAQQAAAQAAPVQTAAGAAAAQRLAQVQQGQQATKSLQGGQSQGNVTAESLLTLEGEEFEKNWKALFGE